MEHRGDIHFGDCDRDRLTGRDNTIADREGDHRAAWPLRLAWRPAECLRRRVERRAGRQARRAVDQSLRREIGVGCTNGEGQQRAFGHRLRPNRGQHRHHIHFADGDNHQLTRRHDPVGDGEGDREGARPLRFGRGPAECVRRRIERRAGRQPRCAIDQRLLREIRIGRVNGEGQRRAFCHRLRPDRNQHRRKIDFADGDGHQLAGRHDPIRHGERDREGAGTLILSRRPDKLTRRGIECRAGWETGRANRKAEFRLLIDRLRSNGGQERSHVDFVDGDRNGFTRRQLTVGHRERHDVAAGPLVFGRRPDKFMCRLVERRPGWKARRAIGQQLRGLVCVVRTDREAQLRLFVDRLGTDRRQHRCDIHFADEDGHQLAGRDDTVRHSKRHHIRTRTLGLRRRPDKLTSGRGKGGTRG